MHTNNTTTPHGSHPALDILGSPEAVRRILVCQLRQLGDVLNTTPSLELLARRFPNAEIHMFTEKKCLPMLENNPHIHTLWAVDKKALRTLFHELRFYAEVAAQQFDLVVDFQQLPRCRWVVGMSRAKVRLSFPPPWYLRPLYTHSHQPAPAYAAAYKANTLAPLGISWQGERPHLYLTAEEKENGAALLTSLGLTPGRFITVDAAHRHSSRRWPARHFAALLDLLADAEPDLGFFLSYGPGEEEYVRDLREAARHKDRMVVPPGAPSLRTFFACQSRAALHIGTCSAPRHSAVALDIPSVTILGSSGLGWEFPSTEHITLSARQFMDMPCQPCKKDSCALGLECLERLLPEIVAPEVLAHLRAFGKRRSTE